MKYIAITGKPFRAFTDFMEINHPEIGLIGLRDKEETYRYPQNVTHVFDLDFSSKERVKEGLPQIEEFEIIGLESQYENGVLAKAWIGELLGLPCISAAAALNATDKGLMRKAFQEKSPQITPAFTVVSSEEEVRSFATEHGFPLILKPANLAKSLLVTKNDTLEELLANFTYSKEKIKKLYERWGVHHRTPTLILEEFLEGNFYSVDLVIDSEGKATAFPPVDLVMASGIGINDNYNYSRTLPANLNDEDRKQLQSAAILGAQSLGLTNSAAHCELVLTKKGPKIIEIGARFGGYRSKMYNLSYGINMYELIYKLAIGEPITVDYAFQAYTAVYELFPTTSGTFSHIENIEKVRELPSFVSSNNPVKPGQEAGLSRDGFKFCANITLSNHDKEVFRKDCRFVEENARVVLK